MHMKKEGVFQPGPAFAAVSETSAVTESLIDLINRALPCSASPKVNVSLGNHNPAICALHSTSFAHCSISKQASRPRPTLFALSHFLHTQTARPAPKNSRLNRSAAISAHSLSIRSRRCLSAALSLADMHPGEVRLQISASASLYPSITARSEACSVWSRAIATVSASPTGVVVATERHCPEQTSTCDPEARGTSSGSTALKKSLWGTRVRHSSHITRPHKRQFPRPRASSERWQLSHRPVTYSRSAHGIVSLSMLPRSRPSVEDSASALANFWARTSNRLRSRRVSTTATLRMSRNRSVCRRVAPKAWRSGGWAETPPYPPRPRMAAPSPCATFSCTPGSISPSPRRPAVLDTRVLSMWRARRSPREGSPARSPSVSSGVYALFIVLVKALGAGVLEEGGGLGFGASARKKPFICSPNVGPLPAALIAFGTARVFVFTFPRAASSSTTSPVSSNSHPLSAPPPR
eukprot:m.107980 g.107980  ORF g.107980 m.107980 type:complete len:465 (-) comp12784_c1_seq1:477-1871(-)